MAAYTASGEAAISRDTSSLLLMYRSSLHGPIHVESSPRVMPNVTGRQVDHLEHDGCVATEPRRRGFFRRALGSGSAAQVPERPGRSRELDRTIRLPIAGIYVRWDLKTSVTIMEWDLKVVTDPTSSVGIYL